MHIWLIWDSICASVKELIQKWFISQLNGINLAAIYESCHLWIETGLILKQFNIESVLIIQIKEK